MTEQPIEARPNVPTRVDCPAAKDPPVRMFIIAAMSIGFGIYCFIDGYIRHLPEKVETLNERLTWTLNHVGAFVLPAIGLAFLIYGAAMLRRRLVADQECIGYAGKPKVPWGDVSRLDASKADKGVLVLHYRRAGHDARLKLDSWKLLNFRELALLIESKVPVET